MLSSCSNEMVDEKSHNDTSLKDNENNGINWTPLFELALHFDNQKQKLQ